MASGNKRTFGTIILQIAVAVYFAVTGLCVFNAGSSISSVQLSQALSILKINTQIVKIILGVVLMLCSLFLLVKLFWHAGVLGTVITIIMLIVWITMSVLVLYADWGNGTDKLTWFLSLSKNLLIIGSLIVIC